MAKAKKVERVARKAVQAKLDPLAALRAQVALLLQRVEFQAAEVARLREEVARLARPAPAAPMMPPMPWPQPSPWPGKPDWVAPPIMCLVAHGAGR